MRTNKTGVGVGASFNLGKYFSDKFADLTLGPDAKYEFGIEESYKCGTRVQQFHLHPDERVKNVYIRTDLYTVVLATKEENYTFGGSIGEPGYLVHSFIQGGDRCITIEQANLERHVEFVPLFEW